MPTDNWMQWQSQLPAIADEIAALAEFRQRPLLVLAASQLDIQLLPKLYTSLQQLPAGEPLDFFLLCRGGDINASRRIAMLLRQHCGPLTVLAPYHCESAATLLALAADNIVTGPMSCFSPIDPHVQVGNDDSSCSISLEDVRQLPVMAQNWFGLSAADNPELLNMLAAEFTASSLTRFYRAGAETRQIANQLLQWQLPELDAAQRDAIVTQLMCGYHSHSFALDGAELATLGLQVQHCAHTAKRMWPLAELLAARISGGARQHLSEPWLNAAILTHRSWQARQANPDGLHMIWQYGDFS